MTGTEKERRQSPAVLATVNEAAYVTGVSRQTINQAIDRREIRARKLRRMSDPSGRAVGGPELVYLRVQGLLSSRARRVVYERLAGLSLEAVPAVLEMEGSVKLDIREPLAEVRHRLRDLDQLKSQVEESPEIRGGEPVFRGTRIPVHMIADFLRRGTPRAEILEDYPALTEESLGIAERYAELYPRRGRPKQAPWRKQEPAHVFGPEDLRD